MSYVITLLDRLPMFGWYMTKVADSNRHSENMCYNEFGLCAQKIANHFRFNIAHNWERFHSKRTRIFTPTSYNFCIATLT